MPSTLDEIRPVSDSEPGILSRTIVVGLVWNRRRQLLLCKMHRDRGVFPGQWGLPGGGLEPGERMQEGLRRELREELGIEVDNIEPAFFKDCLHDKVFADGSRRPVYMIFLVFHCIAASEQLELNEEFTDYRWARVEDFDAMDLNSETKDTLTQLGEWPRSHPAVREA